MPSAEVAVWVCKEGHCHIRAAAGEGLETSGIKWGPKLGGDDGRRTAGRLEGRGLTVCHPSPVPWAPLCAQSGMCVISWHPHHRAGGMGLAPHFTEEEMEAQGSWWDLPRNLLREWNWSLSPGLLTLKPEFSLHQRPPLGAHYPWGASYKRHSTAPPEGEWGWGWLGWGTVAPEQCLGHWGSSGAGKHLTLLGLPIICHCVTQPWNLLISPSPKVIPGKGFILGAMLLLETCEYVILHKRGIFADRIKIRLS